jgi:hypothetical protein
MTAMTIICCEGPACNAGISAADRETAHLWKAPQQTAEVREDNFKAARRDTSKQLAVTPHTHSGSTGRGQHLYRCDRCGHARIYGNADAHTPYYFGRSTFGVAR